MKTDKTEIKTEHSIRHQIAPEYRDLFLDMLCKNLDVSVSILDEDLKYQFISNAAYKQLGISPEKLKVGDSLAKCHELMFQNGLLTSEILEKNKLSAEKQYQKLDVEKRQLVVLGNGTTHSHVRIPLPNNFTMSIAEDVSELVDKEVMLEKSLAIGSAGYWIYDFRTKKYRLSESLKSVIPKDLVANIDQNGILSIIHAEDRDRLRESIKNMPKTDDKFNVVGRGITIKGKTVWSRTQAELVRGPSGKPIQIWAFVKDITEYKEQSEALEKAKDDAIAASIAKSEFLANMSHEIRTPMNGILGMAELLAGSDIDDRQRDFVNVINSSASALLTIINDILDFSKIEARALELDPMPFDLKSAVNDVAALLVPKACEKGLELIIDYAPKLPKYFIGDGGRIRQVLTNLIGNAIKFTKKGHVSVLVDVSEPQNGKSVIRVDVKDTGIGIPEDKVNHIFDKFTQADGSTTRLYGGTGLGLAISKSIVEMMDGRVGLESVLGQGSTFSITVPLPLDEDHKTVHFDSQSIKGKRALIIDDISINRQVLSEQLQSWGLSTHCVENGVEGMEALKVAQGQSSPYNIILLDYLMPGLNGQEWAQIVHANTQIDCPPIVMLSSCDQPVSSKALRDIGIVSHNVKPVREARLHELIVNAIGDVSEEPQGKEVGQVLVDEDDLVNAITANLIQQKQQTDNTPIAQDSAAPVVEIESVESKTNRKVPILVAEDFALNQDVVRLMLAESDFEPIFANNGKEALEAFKREPNRFPAILMDVSMPVMDGYEASRLIKKHQQENGLRATPIIALTGHALKNDRQACLDAGMDDYLTKPVKQVELIGRLEQYAKTPAATLAIAS